MHRGCSEQNFPKGGAVYCQRQSLLVTIGNVRGYMTIILLLQFNMTFEFTTISASKLF